MKMPDKELKRYERFAERIAAEAGAFVNSRIGKIRDVSYKSRMNLVTDVDKKSERLIIKRIKAVFPSHRIISEESGESGSLGSKLVWFIDPIDGTTNFAHGFPFFCVSVGLAYNNELIVGAVFDPVRGELFRAAKGRGAFLNNSRILVTETRSLSKSLLATGFPYRFGKRMHRNIRNFVNFMMRAQAVRRAGSAALDLCYVACGRFDGFWEIDLHPWDTAAGALIVTEAGGRVSTFSNKPFTPFKKELLATNSKVHKHMLEVLR